MEFSFRSRSILHALILLNDYCYNKNNTVCKNMTYLGSKTAPCPSVAREIENREFVFVLEALHNVDFVVARPVAYYTHCISTVVP